MCCFYDDEATDDEQELLPEHEWVSIMKDEDVDQSFATMPHSVQHDLSWDIYNAVLPIPCPVDVTVLAMAMNRFIVPHKYVPYRNVVCQSVDELEQIASRFKFKRPSPIKNVTPESILTQKEQETVL